MGLCGITGSHWLVGRRVSGEGGRGVKKTGCLLECQSEEQEVWHVRVDFNKVTDKRRSSVSSVKRGRYVGTRRFRVRGQRTPEVNKVALIVLKYFNALIAATLIASINTLILTALVFTHCNQIMHGICTCRYFIVQETVSSEERTIKTQRKLPFFLDAETFGMVDCKARLHLCSFSTINESEGVKLWRAQVLLLAYFLLFSPWNSIYSFSHYTMSLFL